MTSCSRPSAPLSTPQPVPTSVTDVSDEAFADLVVRLKRQITAGNVFQVVASRTFALPCGDPLAAYARLRAANPSPYPFYVVGAESVLFGASPETAVKVHGTPRRVLIRPIAGTGARGLHEDGTVDADLDARRRFSGWRRRGLPRRASAGAPS